MNKERLQEIKDSIDFQREVLIANNMRTLCIDEEQELYDEVVKLDNVINELENVIVNFIERHTEDYLDWKYDEKIYLAESNILQKLFDTYYDKLKELKENEQ